jgi:hypothetical protein
MLVSLLLLAVVSGCTARWSTPQESPSIVNSSTTQSSTAVENTRATPPKQAPAIRPATTTVRNAAPAAKPQVKAMGWATKGPIVVIYPEEKPSAERAAPALIRATTRPEKVAPSVKAAAPVRGPIVVIYPEEDDQE